MIAAATSALAASRSSNVLALRVDGSSASLKVAVTAVVVGTAVADPAGVVAVTVGGVVSGAPPLASPPAPQQTGQIPSDIEVHGTLKLPGERTITCYVEGEIHCPSTVTIAKDTRVKARIRAESVIIFGSVEGEVHATGRAVIKSSGTLRGDIHAARVLVEEGAAFSGKSHVNSRAGAPDAGKAKTPAAKKSALAKSVPKTA